ncbi:hypothetical protein LOTGIDRAFT_238519 [Lottia gigantea]|uniref:Claudin n=1 Tax=Lottia gigantea TaxID=225164 RepID=V4CFG5_LOTGI|nr:hypothetical protein LOTGIDRAFT_238519 [Lottia gigantea]ESP00765.1 hypothetical protein LOTGIDRAFT_238519 [Lottia gigantea]
MRLPGKVTYFILLSLGCSAAAFIFHIAALVTQFWRLTSYQGKEYIRDGLWKRCVKIDGIKGYVCGDIQEEEMDALFRAVQCSVLLGLLFTLIGGVSTAGALILAKGRKGHTKLLRFAVVIDHLAVISLIVTIVAYGVYTNKYIKEMSKNSDTAVVFGFSYVVEIITGGLKLLAGIMAEIHIRFKDEVDHLTYQPDVEETMEDEIASKINDDPQPEESKTPQGLQKPKGVKKSNRSNHQIKPEEDKFEEIEETCRL